MRIARTRSNRSNEPSPRHGQPRRSGRVRKEPQNEDYFMGQTNLNQVLGHADQDEDYHPKRRRHYHLDDSQDYSQPRNSHRRSRLPNINKVEALLEWKQHPQPDLPISIVSHPSFDQPVLLEQFHRKITTNNLPHLSLPSLVQGLEAIFINIHWGHKHQNLQDIEKLPLESQKLMSKGIVFIWAPKQGPAPLLKIMGKKGFTYVENLEVINLDLAKARRLAGKGAKDQPLEAVIRILESVEPKELLAAEEGSNYFKQSKRTLLMFRKNSSLKFQLRHQRTCDVVFDMPASLQACCAPDLKKYICSMIETLLPDCLLVQQRGSTEFDFKMMELWGSKGDYRRGWVTVVQE